MTKQKSSNLLPERLGNILGFYHITSKNNNFIKISAIITFLPMGITFGNYMIYYYYLSVENILHLSTIKAWPFITSAVVGCLTGLCLSYIQNKSKTIKFFHFHTMSVGMVLLFIGGLILTIKPGLFHSRFT